MWPTTKDKPTKAPSRATILAEVTRHARELYTTMLTTDGDELVDGELHAIYKALCEESRMQDLPWGSVKEELQQLLGGERQYRFSTVAAGTRRYRVYVVPRTPLPDMVPKKATVRKPRKKLA